MALLEWSTPERRRVDEALPTVPNEIYLSIIELIAPPATVLELHQLKTLSNLSRICRFFANICLPRIFQFVQFSGLVSQYPLYVKSLGLLLCTQIAEKQPLALALAQSVRECCFDLCRDDLYAKKCIAAMSHMKNIRKLQFLECNMDGEYWNMFAALPSVEDLEFNSCVFLQLPVHTGPEKCLKLKVSRLLVVNCLSGHQQIISFIDTGYLRTLAIDFCAIEKADWLRQSAITKLHLYAFRGDFSDDLGPSYTPKLDVALAKAPRSLQDLHFFVDVKSACIMAADVAKSMLEDPAWKESPFFPLLVHAESE